MVNDKLKTKIKESVTNLNTLGRIPADEVQLNLDVAYNSILNEICAVVPMESPRQIISYLKLKCGMPKKAINEHKKDVIDASLMDGVGALPLNEFGYITDEVEFTASESPFMGSFKNIVPGTVKIGTAPDIITDDGFGNLISSSGDNVGTIDYVKAIFNTEVADETIVKYKFDLYDVDTSRNLAYFEKATKEVFANIFQFDVDSAVSLNDFKGVNLQQNIDKLLPEVLTKQIDSYILNKYFDCLEANIFEKSEYEFLDWRDKDIGTHNLLLSVEMGKFAQKTGVVPNTILCDPLGLALVTSCLGFVPITSKEDDADYAGTPRKVGYFNNAKVFVTGHTNENENDGTIILTYRGASDAQASSVYTPFIPVTLRTVSGAEAGGTIVTNNIYSIGGFDFLNTNLIKGIVVKNIITSNASNIENKVENADSNITKILEQKLPELGEKIDTQTETLKTQLQTINTNIDEESEKLNANIDEESEKLNTNIDEESTKTNANIDEESESIRSTIAKAASDVVDSVENATTDITSKMDENTNSIKTDIAGLDTKIDTVNTNVNNVNTNVDTVSDKVDSVDAKVDTVGNKVDTVSDKIDNLGQ